MPRSANEVAAALVAKGMESTSGHHVMYRKKIDGVTTLVTRISHGSSVIHDTNGRLMASQCCLQLREFWALVDCTLTENQWDALVRQRCAGGRNPFMRR